MSTSSLKLDMAWHDSKCSIPIFDGLLPELHNSFVLHLLFTMAHWHRLAKLWMHSDWTLDIMDQVTSAVGQQLCDFKAMVCSAYVTHELRQEVEVRTRCSAKWAVTQIGKHSSSGDRAAESHSSPKNAQCTKTFNLQTYKFHALGNYVSTIHQYGMSNSYSSKPVSPIYFIINTLLTNYCRVNLSIILPSPDIIGRIRNPL
jgi:hypothetical protein